MAIVGRISSRLEQTELMTREHKRQSGMDYQQALDPLLSGATQEPNVRAVSLDLFEELVGRVASHGALIDFHRSAVRSEVERILEMGR